MFLQQAFVDLLMSDGMSVNCVTVCFGIVIMLLLNTVIFHTTLENTNFVFCPL